MLRSKLLAKKVLRVPVVSYESVEIKSIGFPLFPNSAKKALLLAVQCSVAVLHSRATSDE